MYMLQYREEQRSFVWIPFHKIKTYTVKKPCQSNEKPETSVTGDLIFGVTHIKAMQKAENSHPSHLSHIRMNHSVSVSAVYKQSNIRSALKWYTTPSYCCTHRLHPIGSASHILPSVPICRHEICPFTVEINYSLHFTSQHYCAACLSISF